MVASDLGAVLGGGCVSGAIVATLVIGRFFGNNRLEWGSTGAMAVASIALTSGALAKAGFLQWLISVLGL